MSLQPGNLLFRMGSSTVPATYPVQNIGPCTFVHTFTNPIARVVRLQCIDLSTSRQCCGHCTGCLLGSGRIVYKLATLIRKCLIGRAPAYLTEYCRQAGICRPGTRSADTSMLEVPCTRTALGDRSFAIAGPRIWNSLPPSIRDLTLSTGKFSTPSKTYLFV